MREIRRKYDAVTPPPEAATEKDKEEETTAAPSEPSPPGDAEPSPTEQGVVAIVPARATPSPPPTSAEDEQPRAGWNMFSSFIGYLASPFTRKRPAEDPVEPPPSSKRSRVSNNDAVVQESPVVVVEEERTPRPILTPSSLRQYSGPSVKSAKVPTSLSTITEYTEPPLQSSIAANVTASTPSRPPRETPRQSNLLQVPQTTPSRRPLGTPTMRRSAQLRAAHSAGSTTPSTGFTARVSAPRPRESNADARLAKLERVRTLKKELQELEQDEDVKEMESHRVKRVKIDNLAVIPHNRPGDPSGCFRVPEEDSDDEMEVYANVEERSNVFEAMNIDPPEVSKPQRPVTGSAGVSTQDHQPKKPPPSTTNTAPRGISVQDHQPKITPSIDLVFNFPDVGPIPTDYYVSEGYKAEAGRLFTEGFAEFLTTY